MTTSMGEADAKFPDQSGSGLPPSPTRENPGAVFPKSDPKAAEPQSIPGAGEAPENPHSLFSNPYAFDSRLQKVESALSDLIDAIQAGEQSGSVSQQALLMQKFTGWRDEISQLRGGGQQHGSASTRSGPGPVDMPRQEGGLFTD